MKIPFQSLTQDEENGEISLSTKMSDVTVVFPKTGLTEQVKLIALGSARPKNFVLNEFIVNGLFL